MKFYYRWIDHIVNVVKTEGGNDEVVTNIDV